MPIPAAMEGLDPRMAATVADDATLNPTDADDDVALIPPALVP
jgi:hypothetical protein